MNARYIYPLALIALFLTACDSNSASDENSNSLPIAPGNEIINSTLSGRVISTIGFQPFEFVLNSGVATQLPVITTIEHLDNIGASVSSRVVNFFAGNKNATSQQYTETVVDCPVASARACVSVYGSNFQILNRLELPGRDIQVPAKLSRSGQFLAIVDFNLFFSESSRILIADVNASSITDSNSIDHSVASRSLITTGSPVVEWGASDEVLFAVPADISPTIYITNPGTLDVARTLSLPDQYRGYIGSMDLHPDGTQLLLGYHPREDDSNGIVLILDLNTRAIRIPAVNQIDIETRPMNDSFSSRFSTPVWSPDGSWIMFRNGFDSNFIAPGLTNVHNLVVVPANQSRTVVNQVSETTALPAIVVRFSETDTPGQLTTSWPGDTIRGGQISWIP